MRVLFSSAGYVKPVQPMLVFAGCGQHQCPIQNPDTKAYSTAFIDLTVTFTARFPVSLTEERFKRRVVPRQKQTKVCHQKNLIPENSMCLIAPPDKSQSKSGNDKTATERCYRVLFKTRAIRQQYQPDYLLIWSKLQSELDFPDMAPGYQHLRITLLQYAYLAGLYENRNTSEKFLCQRVSFIMLRQDYYTDLVVLFFYHADADSLTITLSAAINKLLFPEDICKLLEGLKYHILMASAYTILSGSYIAITGFLQHRKQEVMKYLVCCT